MQVFHSLKISDGDVGFRKSALCDNWMKQKIKAGVCEPMRDWKELLSTLELRDS